MQIKKGLNIPIRGAPAALVDRNVLAVDRVAIFGRDFLGLKPKMLVQEGDVVLQGQPLFADKAHPNIVFTAPASGTVHAVHRGAKRFLESVVVAVDHEAEVAGKVTEFTAYSADQIVTLGRASVQKQLLSGGLWPQIRTRPYSKLAATDVTPNAFFVNLMDTNPLALDPALVLEGQDEALIAGLYLVSSLTDGPVFVCKSSSQNLPNAAARVPRVQVVEFGGPHPAGLVGTHIHFLSPVNAEKQVWHIDAQDLLGFGTLFLTGRYPSEIALSLAGPMAKRPRIIISRRGACVSQLTDGEVSYAQGSGESDEVRAVAGSLLTGRSARGFHDYLGAYHRQIVLIEEYGPKRLLGWLIPGRDRFSTARVHTSALSLPREYDMSASANGSPRAMVPFGLYEEVMPLDILATQLLRSLLVGDTDTAQGLGALELDEEDLALCSYVCLSKYEYGAALRESLTKIEVEG
ncbi:MAG: Na(+)-translocating NADH-quinone reductase subunit A [Alphaproteobacteria bacterium]|nr:Na(+)-translocating NADH-quinone reductase subunit A [Alphaproteobacteria bacterium]